MGAGAARRGAGCKRIVTVFGCGGNRDRAKRPLMGEAVAISERFDTPVVIRTTMRTSHSKSVVELGEPASYG